MLRHAYQRLCELELDNSGMSPGSVMPHVGTAITNEALCDASAFLECLLVHARVLRYFFANERGRSDDIIASDFVSGWGPRTEELGYIKAQKERLDKSLAHLTTRRLDYDRDGKLWNVTAIMEQFAPVFERFKTDLPDHRRSWFDGI